MFQAKVATRSPASTPSAVERAGETVDATGEIAVRERRARPVPDADHLAVGVHPAHPLQDQLQRQRVVVLHQPLQHASVVPRSARYLSRAR